MSIIRLKNLHIEIISEVYMPEEVEALNLPELHDKIFSHRDLTEVHEVEVDFEFSALYVMFRYTPKFYSKVEHTKQLNVIEKIVEDMIKANTTNFYDMEERLGENDDKR